MTAKWALAALLLASPAWGERLPEPGGAVRVALPGADVAALIEAHRALPLLEPLPADESARRRLAWPPLPGLAWRSRVLTGLSPVGDGARWLLEPVDGAGALADAVSDCFGGDGWVGDALRAAGTAPVVAVADGAVTLTFPFPVGPVPDLLGGCSLTDAGPWAPEADGLGGAASALAPRPLLASWHAVGPESPADLALGQPGQRAARSLSAPVPDVLVLLLPADAGDALGLSAADGLARFRTDLAPELLLAVHWGSRGRPLTRLLPPGLAPDVPEPDLAPVAATTLPLRALPTDAPTFPLRVQPDPLLDGVTDRLAVLLRARGRALVPGAAGDAALVRWRPPVRDPALALLALAGAWPGLRSDPADQERLASPDLLHPRAGRRLEAAIAVERGWLQARRAVPLLSADRWYALDARLRDVRLRPDGTPVLDDAWWTER